MKFKGYGEKDGKVYEAEFDIEDEEAADERLASILEKFKRFLNRNNREATPRPKAITKTPEAREPKTGGAA